MSPGASDVVALFALLMSAGSFVVAWLSYRRSGPRYEVQAHIDSVSFQPDGRSLELLVRVTNTSTVDVSVEAFRFGSPGGPPIVVADGPELPHRLLGMSSLWWRLRLPAVRDDQSVFLRIDPDRYGPVGVVIAGKWTPINVWPFSSPWLRRALELDTKESEPN